MSVLVNKDTRVVVSGITGNTGAFHTRQCIEYGTNIVAGVTPGKGGQLFDEKVPVFNTIAESVSKEGANACVIYVPPPFAAVTFWPVSIPWTTPDGQMKAFDESSEPMSLLPVALLM